MVLLNVLNEGRVVKLCGVVAVGRQITDSKKMEGKDFIQMWN